MTTILVASCDLEQEPEPRDDSTHPDSSRIYFIYSDIEGNEIRVMDSNGGQTRTLVAGQPGSWDALSVSRDERFAHTTTAVTGVGTDIMVWTPQAASWTGSKLDIGVRDDDPAFDPASDSLAFALQIDDSSAPIIVLIPPSGGAMRTLAEGRSPAWSPDGSMIAFVRDSTIHAMARSGGDSHPIARLEFQPVDLAWSPDGTTLLFAGGHVDAFNDEIHSIRIDGTGYQRLTVRHIADRSPTWSPDGSRFAFQRMDGIAIQQLGDTSHVFITPSGTVRRAASPQWVGP